MTDPTPKSLLASLPPEADGLPPELAAVDSAPRWAWSEPDAEGLRSFRCGCGVTLVWGPRDGLTLGQVEASHRRECSAPAPSPRQDPEPQELRGPVAGFKISLAKCAELRQAGRCVGVSCTECEANVERASHPSPPPSREERKDTSREALERVVDVILSMDAKGVLGTRYVRALLRAIGGGIEVMLLAETHHGPRIWDLLSENGGEG